MRTLISGVLLAIASLWLVSCASTNKQGEQPTVEGDSDSLASYSVLSQMPSDSPYPATEGTKSSGDLRDSASGLEKPASYPGSNDFVRAAGEPATRPVLAGDGLVLNFENADLREVVRTILGDFLKIAYIYDPRVQGTVSLQTTKQLKSEDVLATLETLLRMNGAALVADGSSYRIVPMDEAAGQLIPQLGDSSVPLPPGYQVLIVPLEYVSATQMEKLLEPFVAPKGVLRVDIDRNLLLLAGTSRELINLLDTVKTFDVDWLAGMSVGLFPLQQVTPEAMITELNAIFRLDEEGPLAGMLRLEPINRMNAVLVISSQSNYLRKLEKWIKRLDRSSSSGQNLYVYYLQNGKAADIAKILEEVFSGHSESRDGLLGRVAPGLRAVELASKASGEQRVAAGTAGNANPPKAQTAVAAGRTSEGLAFSEGVDIRIIADEVNNSLLILANAQDHRMVLAAIKKLDIVPLQVLIEATIAEVKLTDKMRFGLQWYFKSGDISATLTRSELGFADIASTLPGFSLVAAGTDAKVILDALDKETSVNIVSSPHLMVLDNQTASLQVGDEVPVITQQQQSSISDNATLVNTVEYRNTGVIMHVTPRVNNSGSIIMEVEQEVSTVVPSKEETLTPTISQRKFKSSVVVQSGDTVVLGGLIFDFSTKQREGLPLLSNLPLIGWLFGTTENDDERTELVMLITPRLIRNRYEANNVTQEVRRRLRALKQLQEETVPTPVFDKYSPKRRAKQGQIGGAK